MKILLFYISLSLFIPGHLCKAGTPVFYHRNDGQVTVVEHQRTFFGGQKYDVRRYSNADEAYKTEYRTEYLIAAATLKVLELGYDWYKNIKRNDLPSATNTPSPSDIRPIKLGSDENGRGMFLEVAEIDNDREIAKRFGSTERFAELVRAEERAALIEKRAYAQNKVEIQLLGVDGNEYIMALPSDKLALYAFLVQNSDNENIHRGDLIYSCNGQMFSPEHDLVSILNDSGNVKVTHDIQLCRRTSKDGAPVMIYDSFGVKISSKKYAPTEPTIRLRRSYDAKVTVLARHLMESLSDYQPVWLKQAGQK